MKRYLPAGLMFCLVIFTWIFFLLESSSMGMEALGLLALLILLEIGILGYGIFQFVRREGKEPLDVALLSGTILYSIIPFFMLSTDFTYLFRKIGFFMLGSVSSPYIGSALALIWLVVLMTALAISIGMAQKDLWYLLLAGLLVLLVFYPFIDEAIVEVRYDCIQDYSQKTCTVNRAIVKDDISLCSLHFSRFDTRQTECEEYYTAFRPFYQACDENLYARRCLGMLPSSTGSVYAPEVTIWPEPFSLMVDADVTFRTSKPVDNFVIGYRAFVESSHGSCSDQISQYTYVGELLEFTLPDTCQGEQINRASYTIYLERDDKRISNDIRITKK